MARTVLNEQFIGMNESLMKGGSDDILDMGGMSTLLEETNNTLRTVGVDLEDPECMKNIFRDEASASLYIDGLAEGLNEEDMRNFKALSHNMLDAVRRLAA